MLSLDMVVHLCRPHRGSAITLMSNSVRHPTRTERNGTRFRSEGPPGRSPGAPFEASIRSEEPPRFQPRRHPYVFQTFEAQMPVERHVRRILRDPVAYPEPRLMPPHAHIDPARFAGRPATPGGTHERRSRYLGWCGRLADVRRITRRPEEISNRKASIDRQSPFPSLRP